jgi:hypothetical protein
MEKLKTADTEPEASVGEVLDMNISATILYIYRHKHRNNPDAIAETTRLIILIRDSKGALNLSEEDKDSFRTIAQDVFPPRPLRQR